MPRKHPLANTAEREFEDFMHQQGWDIMKRGMPDFSCFRDGRFMLVEVKRGGSRRVSPAQYKVMMALRRYGVPCFMWEPDSKHLFPIDTLYRLPPHTPPKPDVDVDVEVEVDVDVDNKHHKLQ